VVELVHLLQIWIQPDAQGIEPSYEQTHFPAAARRGRLCLIASHDGRDGSTKLHQDAAIYAALIDAAERATHALAHGRKAYVHVARGDVTVNGNRLGAGDGLMATGEDGVILEGGRQAEVLLFDLS
jgi:redox-sensitive bicupin YhaK (pirin superfamily)